MLIVTNQAAGQKLVDGKRIHRPNRSSVPMIFVLIWILIATIWKAYNTTIPSYPSEGESSWYSLYMYCSYINVKFVRQFNDAVTSQIVIYVTHNKLMLQ